MPLPNRIHNQNDRGCSDPLLPLFSIYEISDYTRNPAKVNE